MFYLLITAGILFLSYWFLVRPHSYWTKNGVPQGKPIPIIGDVWGALTRQMSAPEFIQTIYNSKPNSRYVGIYQIYTPCLMVRDPELIKRITVKDFEFFLERNQYVSPEAEPLFAKNLVSLSGQRWREMRTTLSPSFTSSKMKYMFTLLLQNGDQFTKYFLAQNQDVITAELKDIFSKFANDVIANVVFGFQCNSLKDPNNEFFLMGKEATDFSKIRTKLIFLAYATVPKLVGKLKLTLFSQKVVNFFQTIIKENIESRKKHGFTRPDMITLLLQAQNTDEQTILDSGFATIEESEILKNPKQKKVVITEDDIVAQAFSFFFAGFDSVSILLSFMGYELAINPDVQNKLRAEIDTTREKCGGKITYEAILSMKYLDMVVTETLRKWPSNLCSDRVCTREYTIQPTSPDEKSVCLKPGLRIAFPFYAIQRDPKYYPDPDRFDPERFSDENKHNVKPYTFLPFGSGPRACIASRLALLETKILFYCLLSEFEIIPVEKTQIPLRISKKSITLASEEGIWVGLQRRKKP